MVLIQFIFFTIWFITRYDNRITYLTFKELKRNYLLPQNINENKFRKNRFYLYNDLISEFKNLESPLLNLTSWKKKTKGLDDHDKKADLHQLSCYRKLILRFMSIFWYKEIFNVVFSILLNILFLFTNYQFLLVFPTIFVINLNEFFGFIYKSVLKKYKQFIAILIFIYIVEYNISWITFLHNREIMFTDFLDNSNDKKVITFFLIFSCIIFFFLLMFLILIFKLIF